MTYELFSAMSNEGYDNRMDALPKFVVSTTLSEPLSWNARLLDSIEKVRELKSEEGPPLRCMGSLSLVRSLLANGLLDRLRLVVFPQILGETGREPFLAGLPDIDLELAEQRVLDRRLVLLDYRPLKRRA